MRWRTKEASTRSLFFTASVTVYTRSSAVLADLLVGSGIMRESVLKECICIPSED